MGYNLMSMGLSFSAWSLQLTGFIHGLGVGLTILPYVDMGYVVMDYTEFTP